jgi:signal transduction histidine kinase
VLRRDQIRIPLLGAIASLVFLATLAGGARAILRSVTFADLDEELETLSVAIASDLELQGVAAVARGSLHAGVESNVLAFRLDRHSALVVDRGRVIATAGDLVRQHRPSNAQSLAQHPEGTFTAVEPFSGLGWRCRFRVTPLSGAAAGATLIIFRSIEPTLRTLDRIDRILILFVALGVLGSSAILAIAVRRALRPVEEVTAIAESAEATNMSQRVRAVGGGAEVQRLVAVVNSLFDRLGRSFEAQRRFVADAAHELKTPVATLVAEAQEAMRMDTQQPARDELLRSIARTAKALASETDDLLTLARGESPSAGMVPVDAFAIARAAADSCEPLARERGAAITVQGDENSMVDADEAALKRAIANLIVNALTYGPPAEVEVHATSDEVTIAVSDHGAGIAPEDRERIFDRFVRLPSARRLNPSGSGLGLAIVAQTVANHHGTIRVSGKERGSGAVVTVALPRSRA